MLRQGTICGLRSPGDLRVQLFAGPSYDDFCTIGGSEAGIRIDPSDPIYFSADRGVLLWTDGRASLEVTIVRH